MASVTIKTQGVDLNGAELVNAATESSLRELIDAINGLKGKIGQGGGKGNTGGKAPPVDTKGIKAADAAMSDAADTADSFGDRLKGATKDVSLTTSALAGMGKVAHGLGATLGFANGVVGTLAGGFGSAAKALGGFSVDLAKTAATLAADFGGQVMGTEPKLSAMTSAIGDAASKIPVFGGALSGVISILSSVFEKFEQLRDTQYQLSQSGMSFNNNLMQLQAAATGTGQSLAEFAGILQSNKENVAKFGGTMTQGATQFANLSKTIRTGYGSQLAGMGISLQQINEELPGLMALQSQGARANNASMSDMAKSAVQLTKEFDVTAKLTGISNKEQAAALAKKTSDAAFQLKLSQMDEETKKKTMAAMARAQSEFGDAGADAVKRLTLGMPALTEEQRALEAAAPGFIGAMKDNVDKAKDAGVSMDEYGKTLDSNSRKGSASLAKAAKDNETAIYAGSAGLPGLGKVLGDTLSDTNKNTWKYMDRDGKLREDKMAEDQAAARKEQKARDGIKGGLDGFELAMRNLKDVLLNKIIMPLVTFITPAITAIAEGLTKFVNFIAGLDFAGIFGKTMDGAETAGNAVTSTLKDMGIDLGAVAYVLKNFDLDKTLKSFGINFEGIFKTSKELFSSALTELGPGLKTLGGGLVESGKLAFVTARDFFKDIMEGIDFKGIGGTAIAFGKEILADINEIFVDYLQPLFERIAATIRVLGPKLGPIITDLAEIFMAFYYVIEKIVKTVLTVIMPVVKPIANLLIDSFVPFVDLLGGLIKIVKGIVTGDLSTIGDGMKQVWSAFTGEIEAIGVAVRNILNVLDPVWKAFKVGWVGLTNGLEKIGDFFKSIPLAIEKFISDSALGGLAEKLGLVRSKEEIAKDEAVAIKEREARDASRNARMTAAQDNLAGSKFGEQGTATPSATGAAMAQGKAAAGNISGSMTSAPSGPKINQSQAQLVKSGLKLKQGDVQAEGEEISPKIIDMAKKVQSDIPGFKYFSAFNDKYHNEKSPRSFHAKGQAMDFTVAEPPTPEQGKSVVNWLKQQGASLAIDEYNNPSSKATAGHYHAQIQAKTGGVFDGPDTGYPAVLHGTEIVIPTDPASMAKMSEVMGTYVAQRVQDTRSVLGKGMGEMDTGRMLDKDFTAGLSGMMGNASQFIDDMFGKVGLPSAVNNPAAQIAPATEAPQANAGGAADPVSTLSKTLDSLNSTIKELPKQMGSNKEMTDMLSEMVNQMKKNVDVSTKIHRAVN